MAVRIEFETSNAAFDEDSKAYAIQDILDKIGNDIVYGVKESIVRDVNGNKIGSWSVTD